MSARPEGRASFSVPQPHKWVDTVASGRRTTVSDVGAADVVIASNRGPLGFRRDADGSIVSSRGGGGLVSGMAGLSADGSTLWVCAALSDTDREVAGSAPDGRLDLAGHDTGGAVQMLSIDATTLAGAYTSIANATLWYLHHHLVNPLQPLVFDRAWRRDWAAYVRYNEAFAEAVSADAVEEASVLVQDYQLTLLPALLRARRPDLRIGHFTHTPWASPSVFATLPPDIARDLLVGILGADSAGFHSQRWAREFLDCCVAILGAEAVDGGVRYDGRLTAVRIHPLGVDAAPLLARAAKPDVAERRTALAAEIGDRQTIVRVDRTEPSKNIARGLEAFRDLLVRFPEHREHVVHVALAYPSRQDVADYRRYTKAVDALAREINAEFAMPSWTPVMLTVRDDYALSLATLQIGDVLLINPVRDGMNLVAKEAALLTRDAVLVLSREAGAADEMGEFALLVDPFDVSATADALHEALAMPNAERARRHLGLVHAATALPPREWLQQQLDALT
jgi:trehalose 6-phosphate synthase